MAEHPINDLMETAMQNIKNMVDVNTIVGEPVESKDGTIIIPISKVSFGFGAAGSDFGQKTVTNSDANFGGGSGGGATIKPVAFMVVGKEEIKLMPIEKNNTPTQDIIECIPTLLNKVSKLFKKKKDTAETETEEAATVEVIETL